MIRHIFLSKAAIIFSLGLLTSLNSKSAVTQFEFNSGTYSAITSSTTSTTGTDGSSTATNTTYTVYGGWAGACSTKNGTSVCNSCSGRTMSVTKACNVRSIYDEMSLRIVMRFDSVPANAAWAFRTDTDQTSLATFPSTIEANRTYEILISWGSLCNLVIGKTCNSITEDGIGGEKTFYIGLTSGGTEIDTNSRASFKVAIHGVGAGFTLYHSTTTAGCDASAGEGFCLYRAQAGDEKVYFYDLKKNISTRPPSVTSGVRWKALRVYSVPNAANFDFSLDANYKDFEIVNKDDTGRTISISNNRFDGLTNDIKYSFAIGTVSEAENVMFFTDPTTPETSPVIVRTATPSQVVGLLDNKKCFIATAAFGSEWAPQVELLRQFRNEVLIPSKLGRAFVDFYYKNSPPIADFIRGHENLKWAVRTALTPLVEGAKWALNFRHQGKMSAQSGSSEADIENELDLVEPKIQPTSEEPIPSPQIFDSDESSVDFADTKNSPTEETAKPDPRIQFADEAPRKKTHTSLVDQEQELQNRIIQMKRDPNEPLNTEPVTVRKPSPGKTYVQEELDLQNRILSEKKRDADAEISPDPNLNRYPRLEAEFTKPARPASGGTLKTPHPESAKGLISIDRDGVYQYRTQLKPKSSAISVRGGVFTRPVIDGGSDITYEKMYTSENPGILMVDYEWQPFSKFGRLGLQLGAGIAQAKGSGRFKKDGSLAPETYSLYMIPMSAFLNYRFEYMRRQWIVPFINGGGTAWGLYESRDDGKKNSFAGTISAGGGGGVHFSISALDKASAYRMQEEYGVGDLWLTVEARVMQGLSQEIDFTNQTISAGLTVDY